MQKAVEGGGGRDGVAGEDVAPVAEGFVRGVDGVCFFFVALSDDLDEQRGLVVVEAEVADFVDDEQLGVVSIFM